GAPRGGRLLRAGARCPRAPAAVTRAAGAGARCAVRNGRVAVAPCPVRTRGEDGRRGEVPGRGARGSDPPGVGAGTPGRAGMFAWRVPAGYRALAARDDAGRGAW